MKRRQFLALAGGGVVLAAGGGATAWLTTRTPERALQPWKAAAEDGYPAELCDPGSQSAQSSAVDRRRADAG
jgi:hypothetical protein